MTANYCDSIELYLKYALNKNANHILVSNQYIKNKPLYGPTDILYIDSISYEGKNNSVYKRLFISSMTGFNITDHTLILPPVITWEENGYLPRFIINTDHREKSKLPIAVGYHSLHVSICASVRQNVMTMIHVHLNGCINV